MNKKYISIIGSIASAAAIAAGAMVPAFAQTAAGLGVSASASVSGTVLGVAGVGLRAGASATLSARITNITDRANEEIVRRVDALNALSARVSEMTRISAEDQSDLSAGIQTQISALDALQTKIGADATANNTSSLKADVDSITSSYRIFALILPQGAIEAAADRVLDISGTLGDLSTKFSARISAAAAAGNDVTAASTTLADMNAKTADATTQAQAAISEVASLTPDNGNATVMASNTAALKDAHAKIQAAQQDFVAARADAMAIIKDLASFTASANANATATASTSAQ